MSFCRPGSAYLARVAGGAAAALLVLLMTAPVVVVVVAQHIAKLEGRGCSTSDEYVYPYWSCCASPVLLNLGLSFGTFTGEWLQVKYEVEDESTSYILLSALTDSVPAMAAATDDATDRFLRTNSTAYIYNQKSGRALKWIKVEDEDEDKYLLGEGVVSTVVEGAAFLFLKAAQSVNLPCPITSPPSLCLAYVLLSTLDNVNYFGLQRYQKGNDTFIKAAADGSTGDLPIFLARPMPTSPFCTTPRVTHHHHHPM